MKPALLVDAHAAGASGLARHTRELVHALSARADFRMIYLAGDPATLANWLPAESRTPVSLLPFRHARHSPRVPLAWARVEQQVPGPRVSWFPHWDGAWSAAPGVATIHDLIHLSEPGVAGAAKGLVARAWIGRMVEHSAALVCVSEYVAAQLVAEFPRAAGKVTVVPNGVAGTFERQEPRDAAGRTRVAAAVGVPAMANGRYLLTVGNKRAHKRFETAIETLALLAAEQPDLHLVMVGARDTHAATLRALAAARGLSARVHDVVGLDDASLASTYAQAEALLVTSREEGFGLIAVEAMAAGCPVIAVDRGPFREVIGSAGVLVPYDNPAAIAEALRQLDAAAREALVAAGRVRAQGYTWARAAERLALVLTEACK